MNKIPIFDSLTHPTIDGNWILPKYPQMSRIYTLIEDMDTNNISWAFAVGMEGIGGYEEKKYIELFSDYKNKLFPVAFFPYYKVKSKRDIYLWVESVKKLGYYGIKIHPRISNLLIEEPLLVELVRISNKLELSVLFCTYFYSNQEKSFENNIFSLQKFLYEIKNDKIILLHSGAVKLLELMEIARAYDNILLDLSLTICKYENSSIDLDIKHMFEYFDRRICIGTDHPEFRHSKLRARFEKFSKNLSNEKRQNIAFKNIIKFCKLNIIE